MHVRKLTGLPDTPVGLAIHGGAALAANIDGKLQYFGTTLEHALTLAEQAPGGHILVSPAVGCMPGTREEIAACGGRFAEQPHAALGGVGVLLSPPGRHATA